MGRFATSAAVFAAVCAVLVTGCQKKAAQGPEAGGPAAAGTPIAGEGSQGAPMTRNDNGPVRTDAQCKPGADAKDLKDQVVDGQGCTEKEAKEAAVLNASARCTGTSDPKCPAPQCNETNRTCQTTALQGTPSFTWAPTTSVADPSCSSGRRYTVHGTKGTLHCRCACR